MGDGVEPAQSFLQLCEALASADSLEGDGFQGDALGERAIQRNNILEKALLFPGFGERFQERLGGLSAQDRLEGVRIDRPETLEDPAERRAQLLLHAHRLGHLFLCDEPPANEEVSQQLAGVRRGHPRQQTVEKVRLADEARALQHERSGCPALAEVGEQLFERQIRERQQHDAESRTIAPRGAPRAGCAPGTAGACVSGHRATQRP